MRSILFSAFVIVAALQGDKHAYAQNVPVPAPVCLYGAGNCSIQPGQSLYLQGIASSYPGAGGQGGFGYDSQQFANSIYNAAIGTMSQDVGNLSTLIDRDNEALSAGIAMASALTILPPNPGDRFSLTFGGAGFNGQGAGAITATARLSENALIFVGYARSQAQYLIKGGISFSIH
jgi:hypothetical protein